MEENIIEVVYSEESQRHAMLVEDGNCGILYLHAPSSDANVLGHVVAASFVFNRFKLIDFKDVAKYRPNPPPIAKGYGSDQAVCSDPEAYVWSIQFSVDGEQAVVLRDSVPWALVSEQHRKGLSKAISTSGPWGGPWSTKIYQETSGENA